MGMRKIVGKCKYCYKLVGGFAGDQQIRPSVSLLTSVVESHVALDLWHMAFMVDTGAISRIRRTESGFCDTIKQNKLRLL